MRCSELRAWPFRSWAAAVTRPAQSRAVLPAMKPGTARAFALRRYAAVRGFRPGVAELGVVRRLRTSPPSNERTTRHSKSGAIIQAPRFEDFQFRVYREPDVVAFGSSRRFCSRRFRDYQAGVHGESESIFARSLSRGAHAQTLERATAPSVSTARRLLAFLRRVRFTESQLSRHSRSSIHRESGRCSRNSFRASVLTQ